MVPNIVWGTFLTNHFKDYKNANNFTILESAFHTVIFSLQWRHDERDGVSNRHPQDGLLNRLFRRRWRRTSKSRVTGLRAGNSSVTGEFSAQRASNAKNVSIWWRHHIFRPHPIRPASPACWMHICTYLLKCPSKWSTMPIVLLILLKLVMGLCNQKRRL